MRAKREFRDRRETEVSVLDALVDRSEDGMTVFELRAAVSVGIDDLEAALADLKADGLITVEQTGSQTVIKPAARVIPDEPVDEERSALERIRDRLPF